jgi:hypothetical protein
VRERERESGRERGGETVNLEHSRGKGGDLIQSLIIFLCYNLKRGSSLALPICLTAFIMRAQ